MMYNTDGTKVKVEFLKDTNSSMQGVPGSKGFFESGTTIEVPEVIWQEKDLLFVFESHVHVVPLDSVTVNGKFYGKHYNDPRAKI